MPDFNLNIGEEGPNSTSKHDEATPDGMEELFMFSPWTQSGEVTFFNWMNANVSGYDGIEVSDKKKAPGWQGPMFSKLPNDAVFATDRPNAFHGKKRHLKSRKDLCCRSKTKFLVCLSTHTMIE